MTKNYTIAGMTCGHCAKAVQLAAKKTPGVADAQITLAPPRLTVTWSAAADDASLGQWLAKMGNYTAKPE